jgi:hypothetical protein
MSLPAKGGMLPERKKVDPKLKKAQFMGSLAIDLPVGLT